MLSKVRQVWGAIWLQTHSLKLPGTFFQFSISAKNWVSSSASSPGKNHLPAEAAGGRPSGVWLLLTRVQGVFPNPEGLVHPVQSLWCVTLCVWERELSRGNHGFQLGGNLPQKAYGLNFQAEKHVPHSRLGEEWCSPPHLSHPMVPCRGVESVICLYKDFLSLKKRF